MTKTGQYFLALIALLLLGGCASKPTADDSTGSSSPVESEVQSEPVKQDIEPETLYDLLIAEMGGKMNRLEIALGNYMRQAHKTQDPGIIERYAKIASYMQARQAMFDAAQLWLKVDPKNLEALHLMLIYQIAEGTETAQKNALKTLLSHTTKLNILLIEQQLNNTKPSQRMNFRDVLADALSPNAPSAWLQSGELWYIKAKTHSLLQEHEQVINSVHQLQKYRKDFLPSYILLVDAYEKTGQIDKAKKNLETLSKLDPENKKIRIYYAKALIQSNDFEAAKREFQSLLAIFPNDLDIKLTTAALAIQTQDYVTAKPLLETLIEGQYRTEESLMQLAEIQIHEERPDLAVETYLRIEPSRFFEEARFRAAEIVSETQGLEAAVNILKQSAAMQPSSEINFLIFTSELYSKFDQQQNGIDLLTESLKDSDNEPSLLYSRALLYCNMGEYRPCEEDLRQVLKIKPNNVAALNALGYTLVDQNRMLMEAESLLEQAIKLSPDDPHILDSIGWLKYRQGDLRAAREYLEKAYAALPDPEIAAHLGEILWLLNEKKQALRIWEQGLEKENDSSIILNTMERLEAN